MVAKQQRGQDTADRLLDAALLVYAENGVDRFTLKAVLDASGISVGSAYHHFGSLESLALALYNRCMRHQLDQVSAALVDHTDARDGVHAVVHEYLRWAQDNRPKAVVVHTLPFTGYFPGIATKMREDLADKFVIMLGWFQRQIEAGQIRAMPPNVLDALVLGPLFVIVHNWISDIPGIDLDEAADDLPDSIWRALRA